MKVAAKVFASIGLIVALLGAQPEAAQAAEAQTCARSYMVCLNNRPEGTYLEETLAESRCLSKYFSCLAEQAFDA